MHNFSLPKQITLLVLDFEFCTAFCVVTHFPAPIFLSELHSLPAVADRRYRVEFSGADRPRRRGPVRGDDERVHADGGRGHGASDQAPRRCARRHQRGDSRESHSSGKKGKRSNRWPSWKGGRGEGEVVGGATIGLSEFLGGYSIKLNL